MGGADKMKVTFPGKLAQINESIAYTKIFIELRGIKQRQRMGRK